MLAIIKKELKSYFLTPVGYVFIGLFLLLVSTCFCVAVFLNGTISFEAIFAPVISILTFIIPILTMRTFAEERKNGTEILLFTSPRGITSIVLAKFFASTIVLLVTAVGTLMYYFVLRFFGEPNIIIVLTSILRIYSTWNGIHFFWNICIKHNGKPDNCRNNNNSIFSFYLVCTGFFYYVYSIFISEFIR